MKISQNLALIILSLLFVNVATAQTWTSFQSPQHVNDLIDTGSDLYMGTDLGLVVLNKSSMQKGLFNAASTNLTDNEIVSVAQDPSGTIWVASLNGTIESFNGSSFSNIVEPNHVNFHSTHTDIIDFEIAPNGDFWVATDDGVFHRQGSNWSHYAQAEFGSTFFEPWDIEISSTGEVYIATNEVFKFSNGIWTNILGSSTLQNYLHADMLLSSSGDLFMTGDLDHIGRFDGTQWQEYPIPVSSGWQFKDMTEDANGTIYIRTLSNGVYKLAGNTWIKHDNAQTQAANDQVDFFYVDTQGNHWLNKDISISVMSGNGMQNTTIASHTMTSNDVQCLTAGNDGSMYFAGFNSNLIAKRDAAGNWSALAGPPSLSVGLGFSSDLLVESSSSIWLAVNSGLYHYNGSTWTQHLSQSCRDIVSSPQDKIYVRGNNRIYVIDNGSITEFNSSNSPIAGTNINGHGVDANGNLWLAETDTNTLRKLSPDGTWTEFLTADHSGLEAVGSKFHFDVNGNLWMVAASVGVVKFDGTIFSNPYSGNIGQMANYEVTSIESDAAGTMYFSHEYGVTTWQNGQWGNLLISDVPNNQSIFDSSIEFDNAGNLWWASSRYGVFSAAGFSVVLPVDLLEFSAQNLKNNSIEISWKTLSEVNSDYFSVEHSLDGSTFSEIGKVNSAGFSSELLNYAFIHEDLDAGQHYYRLKQVDLDGRMEYSDIVTVVLKNGDNNPSITPNPSSGIINIQSKNILGEGREVQIINIQGQVVYTEQITGQSLTHSLDISHLSSGIYYLRLLVGSELVIKRLIKE